VSEIRNQIAEKKLKGEIILIISGKTRKRLIEGDMETG